MEHSTNPGPAAAAPDHSIDANIPGVYDELRRLAHAYLRGEQRTIQATALVHEAYIKLAEAGNPVIHDRAHFFALAARVMRQVVVDYARGRRARKRGSGERPVELKDTVAAIDQDASQVLAIHEALERLAVQSPERARLVEMRFFGGMTGEECGEALGMSAQQAYRELRLAQAWLRAELSA